MRRTHHGLASGRWGGRRGGGRLRRHCVLPDELRGGRLALDLSSLRCGATADIDQLGGGPDEEQGVHASQHPAQTRVAPFASLQPLQQQD